VVFDGSRLSERYKRSAITSVVESSFTIIAEPNRRAILSLLLSSERSVGEIERELQLRSDSGFPSASDTLRSVLG